MRTGSNLARRAVCVDDAFRAQIGDGLAFLRFVGPVDVVEGTVFTDDDNDMLYGGATAQSCPAPPRTEIFDFMSYCACPDESDSWTSIPNWNAWGSAFPSGLIPCGLEGCSTAIISEGSASAGAQTTRVVASIDQTGAVSFDSIEPGDGRHLATATNSADPTTYYVVARDATGTVISRNHVTPVVSHQHAALTAETGGARIEIERNGTAVALKKPQRKSAEFGFGGYLSCDPALSKRSACLRRTMEKARRSAER